MSSDTSTLTVDLGERSYDIVIGAGVLIGAGALIKPHLDNNRVIVITDKNVAKQWLGPLEDSLNAAGISHEGVFLPTSTMTPIKISVGDSVPTKIPTAASAGRLSRLR